MILLSALIVSGVVWWATMRLVAEIKTARDERASARTLALMQLFAPALGASERDPRALLVWQPLAKTARQMFPVEFAALDRGAGGTFPFTKSRLEAAHAEWTADWLAWERAHDAEYKLKAATLEHERAGEHDTVEGSSLRRARIDAVEREKLDLYQRRYEEYIRVARALQNLAGESS